MIPLTLAQIAHATAGHCPPAGGAIPIAQVSTDSRNIPSGCLFIALRGDRFDAHDFLPQVAAAGAAAALIDRPGASANLRLPCITVDNTRKALGELGAYVRRRFVGRAIAIGGSNGKTTTKHLVGSVLASAFKGTVSPKSFNNDIGVPLTLLGVRPGDDYVVLELGTNHPGELSPLSRIAHPEIAAITSIGPEHLEGFGDLDGVRREEVCLLDGLAPGGLCIANADDPRLVQLACERTHRIITFGFSADADVRVESVNCGIDGIRFKLSGRSLEFSLPLPGRHNASNALVAIIIGREFGLSDGAIREALANCSRPEMRMQVSRIGQYTVLNDAYNANPASMLAALETIANAAVPGRRIAVLGEMRELGNSSRQMHRDVGVAAAGARLAALITVGASELADAAIDAGMPRESVHSVPDSAAAASLVPTLLRPLDTLLLKGSRGVKLELVAQALAAKEAIPDAL